MINVYVFINILRRTTLFFHNSKRLGNTHNQMLKWQKKGGQKTLLIFDIYMRS